MKVEDSEKINVIIHNTIYEAVILDVFNSTHTFYITKYISDCDVNGKPTFVNKNKIKDEDKVIRIYSNQFVYYNINKNLIKELREKVENEYNDIKKLLKLYREKNNEVTKEDITNLFSEKKKASDDKDLELKKAFYEIRSTKKVTDENYKKILKQI